VIAATLLDGAAIPMIMNTDKEAVQLAVKTVLHQQIAGITQRGVAADTRVPIGAATLHRQLQLP